MRERTRTILGWIAIGCSLLMTCLWTFWGIIENFHEGWYYRSLKENLFMMVGQYLLLMFVFMGATLVSLYFPRTGATLHFAGAGFAVWFFRGAAGVVIYFFIALPLILLGAGYWVGRPAPRKLATGVVIGLPLLVLVGFAIEPIIRISGRIDDGHRGARFVQGNGVSLMWAPAGPGWPSECVSWEEARRRCVYLSEDGHTLSDAPLNLWRLPTVEEAVRSMARHGQNCGGEWNALAEKAKYRTTPDKESPLWDKYSKVIYWWTATEAGAQEAYIIVYNGQVYPRPKKAWWGYLAFRAVRAR